MNKENNPIEVFRQNVYSVEKLVDFDHEVQDIAIVAIEELHQHLVDIEKIENPLTNGERTLEILRSIRTNDALKPKYKTIYNQAVVLLVSYFGSALADIFRYAAKVAIINREERNVLDEKISLKIEDLLGLSQKIEDEIGDLLIKKTKKDISFQDMKSVRRSFGDYFGIKIEKGERVNNIILGQACRNSIVHEGGVVNSRVIYQVRDAKPRMLKVNIVQGESISFSIEEINLLSKSMLEYVQDLMDKVDLYEKSSTQLPNSNVDRSGE